MPIDLYTGQPGNGKTALMMERLTAEAAKAERPVYAAGIDGLNVDGVVILEDARRWNDRDANGEFIVPDGSLIFVDEVWKFFGHLQDASRAPNPPHVLALAEHRHRGIDFVWTTQMPNQLYPFARGLIADHYHVVRRFGTQFVDVFQWGELNEDVKSQARRENAQRTTRRLPSAVFEKYKSATLHTIKRRIPWKVWAIPLVLVAGVGALLFAVQHLRAKSMADRLSGKETSAAQAAPAPAGGSSPVRIAYSTAEEYQKFTAALVPAAPWTAPAFAGRQVASDPKLFCMSSGAGRDASGKLQPESCHCFTEQGTPYVVPNVAMCKAIARDGAPYNPFQPPLDNNQGDGFGRGRDVASNDATQTPHASGGSSQPYGTGAAYGDLGVR